MRNKLHSKCISKCTVFLRIQYLLLHKLSRSIAQRHNSVQFKMYWPKTIVLHLTYHKFAYQYQMPYRWCCCSEHQYQYLSIIFWSIFSLLETSKCPPMSCDTDAPVIFVHFHFPINVLLNSKRNEYMIFNWIKFTIYTLALSRQQQQQQQQFSTRLGGCAVICVRIQIIDYILLHRTNGTSYTHTHKTILTFTFFVVVIFWCRTAHCVWTMSCYSV